MINMDNYYDIEEPKKKKGFTVGKLIKWLFLAVVLFIYVTLVVRCTMYKDDRIVSKIITDEITVSAYNENEEEFKVQQYGMNSAWVAIQEGRLIEFNYLYHIPSANQLQFSVKYNLDIAPVLGDKGILFSFRLKDSKGREYNDFFFENKNKFGYGYIRVCFNDIVLEDLESEPDENGFYPRLTYTLYIDELNDDGTYSELCTYRLYNGSRVCRNVNFKNIK